MNAPDLELGLELYFGAFMDLTTCRPLGFGGEGQIPWLAIRAWAEDNDLSDDQRQTLYYVIAAMDAEYMKLQARKAEANK